MKTFHCGSCDQLVFFENTACVRCGGVLAFLPDAGEMATLERDPATDGWRPVGAGAAGPAYRRCKNDREEGVCNWAVHADDPSPYCLSCRLTRVIPNLAREGARAAWARLEAAKRRLLYSLIGLGLATPTKAEDPEGGLAFEFLADPDLGTPGAVRVLTGHAGGLITINVAEADDAERERRRTSMGEPYRTLLGHFRHEVGHYYWDRLVRDSDALEGFRALFGDERHDYAEALGRYHRQGAPADWPGSFISAYATAHPWEDWAESWAHYMHMIDTLETAVEAGLSLHPRRPDEPAMRPDVRVVDRRPAPFDALIERWIPLTYVLNNLNRGMGLPDAYPFVLSGPAVEKLRFIHGLIG